MRRTYFSSIRTIPAALCALVLLGCGTSSRVVTLYENPEFTGGPFTNILVLGVHEDADARRRFESGVASAIREGGTSATPSLNFMRSTDEISRDSIVEIVETENFDAVLVTRLVDLDIQIERREGRSTAQAQRRDDLPLVDFFRYDYVEYQDPMTSTTVRTVVLVTDLYNVADESKVWSVESTSIQKDGVYELINDISGALASALTRDNLIR
ncbi:MAG: hypothetical protein GWN29_09730 [Gammaproteobacteria bacterium]|nr:hypothetical protein [Gammaproteobacteria bacterium]